MDTEPTGRTIDGIPWEEPRPPHLPDQLTRFSPWSIPFLLLAALQIIVGWQQWAASGATSAEPWLAWVVTDRLPSLAATLLGAALFLRHPQAHRTLPAVTVGVALLALAELLRLVAGPLGRLLPALSTGTDEFPFTTPFLIGSFVFVSVVTVVGIVNIARGLRAARRSKAEVSVRGRSVILIAISVVATGIAAWTTANAYDAWGTLSILAVTSTLIVSLAFMFAWSYLLLVALEGWVDGERPQSGWLLAGLGAGIVLANAVFVAVSGLLPLPPDNSPVVLQVLVLSYVAGWLLLLLAFVMGVPATVAETVESDETVGATADRPAVTTPGSGAG